MAFTTIIAVVSLAGLNIEDWIWAKKTFAGNKLIESVLDATKPDSTSAAPNNPIVQSNAWPLFFLLALAYLIMRIGL